MRTSTEQCEMTFPPQITHFSVVSVSFVALPHTRARSQSVSIHIIQSQFLSPYLALLSELDCSFVPPMTTANSSSRGRFVLCPQPHLQTPSSEQDLSIVVSRLCIHIQVLPNDFVPPPRENKLPINAPLTKQQHEIRHHPCRLHGALRQHGRRQRPRKRA